MIDAKEDVMTTCFTVGAFFLMALRMPGKDYFVRTQISGANFYLGLVGGERE